MHIAIIGSGFCGLACAWQLAQKHRVVVFDSLDIGQGTSGMAAGLLHPYAGSRSKKNWRADEGMQATLKLLAIAKQHSGQEIYRKTGLLRPATTEQQYIDFMDVAEQHPDIHKKSADECQALFPGLAANPAILIDEGYIVDCPAYLQGLWKACEKLGVSFEKKKIGSLTELHTFDRIVVAGGAASNKFPELSHLKITPIKGQLFELSWPDTTPKVPYPLSSQAYLLMSPDGKCIAGASYERHFVDELPDLDAAAREIIPKIAASFPAVEDAIRLNCRAGVRASAARHRPLLVQTSPKHWVLTGMGSKGLLYHALFAQELAQILECGD